MITGNPEAVETAARSLSTAGTGFAETGETVDHHAGTLDASWSGSASGAATRSITGLAQRIGSGGPPCANVHDALITYAQALRDAQREWAAAHASATAGESALDDAKADQIRARALPAAQDDPHTGPVVSSPAIRAADSARTTAADSVAAAKTAMADAVAKLAQANQAAATAVDAATEALADMGGTGAPEGGPAEAIEEGRARRVDGARVDDQQPDGFGDAVKNVVGGAGDGAWKIGPGVLGWSGGLIPGRVGDAIEGTVEGWHDDLERSFGADTGSLAYRGTSGGVQVASLFIPGMGVVKAGRVIGAARDVKALGVVGSAAKAAGAVRAAPAAARAASAGAVRSGVRAARVVGELRSVAEPSIRAAISEAKAARPAGQRTFNYAKAWNKGWNASGWDRAKILLDNRYDKLFRATARKLYGIEGGGTGLPRPEAGATIERFYGSREDLYGPFHKGSLPFGASWTPDDMREYESLRRRLGLPNENPARFGITAELVKPENIFHVRPAVPLNGNPGGAVEYMIFDPENAVVVKRVFGVNEAFTHQPDLVVDGLATWP